MDKGLIELGNKLDGDSLIIYVLCLGLLAIIGYLIKSGIRELHENSKHLAGISEQLRTLVQAAIQGRND